MNLQEIIIQRIEDYGGRAALTQQLRACVKLLPRREKKHLKDIIRYINSLYKIEVDIVRDCAVYPKERIRFLEAAQCLSVRHKSQALIFVHRQIVFCVNHAIKIRDINAYI